MADNFVKEYVELSRDIESKRKVFKKSIASLEQEIADRTQAFNDSIQDLTIKEKEYVDKIKEEGEDILWKIGKILKNKVNWYDINKYLKEFGIITEPYEDSTEDESYLNYNCLLRTIEEITDTHIKFSAEQFFGDELEYGYVSIPIKYFGTNLLDDEDYLAKIFANIKIQKENDREEFKQKEIAELEVRLAELKGETV